MGVGDVNRTSPPHFLLADTEVKPEADTKIEPPASLSSLGIQARVGDIIKEDVDEELPLIAGILSEVHKTFFDQLASPDSAPPDVKEILDARKRTALAGTSLAFSGIIPTGMPPERFELWRLATMFGASCSSAVQPGSTTHLITFRTDTDKVLQAVEAGDIAIVRPDWLLRCFREWRRVPEQEYRLASLPPPRGLDVGSLDPEDLLAMNRELAELDDSEGDLREDGADPVDDHDGEGGSEPDPKRRHLGTLDAPDTPGNAESDSDDDFFVKTLERDLL